MPLDYSTKRQIQATSSKVGIATLTVVVRAGASLVFFLARFLLDMAKSIVGAK